MFRGGRESLLNRINDGCYTKFELKCELMYRDRIFSENSTFLCVRYLLPILL